MSYPKLFVTSPFFVFFLTSALTPSPAEANVIDDYTEFKNYVSEQWNINYSIGINYLAQTAVEHGGKIPYQSVYNPNIVWNIFNNEKYGSGKITFNYKYVTYLSKTEGSDMSNNLGVVSAVNNNPDTDPTFNWLAYTHTFNETINVTVGQYPISNFDWVLFSSNQYPEFINDSLGGNASEIYPSAGLGAFVTVNPTNELSISMGMQTAEENASEQINFKNLGKKYAAFGTFSYSPKIPGLGSGTYSALLYYQPSVEGTPESSVGFSFSALQNINEKVAVFASFNHANASSSIESSILGGLVIYNPLNRNPDDQIGLVAGYNWLNEAAVGENARNSETIIETYWAWGFTQYMQIIPDIQLYIKPALDREKDAAAVFSLGVEFSL